MPLIFYSVAALVAYLLGSIPFGYLLVRFFRKEDIRQKGSGNIGATNVMRSGSKGLGAVTFLLDVLKGFFAVWLCGMVAARSGLGPDVRTNAIAIAALFVVLGHIYTVWLGFKGGKGVATAFGVFLAISRYVSLGSILSALAFPVLALLMPHPPRTAWATAVLFIIPTIVVLRHHENIARLMKGTEYRFDKTGMGKPGTNAA
jgi:glycerol-3-phosphate acyltransferase PlsY